LNESLEPLRATVALMKRSEHWLNSAIAASNLSELELTLGEVAKAVGDAEQSVTYADRSGDAFWRKVSRVQRGNMLHQAGHRGDAEPLFGEAEQMQKEEQPDLPLLYSLQGFLYCDLLLGAPERAAWQWFVVPPSGGIGGKEKPPEGGTKNEGVLASCRAVFQRAVQTLKIAERKNWLLDIALAHLTLGLAALYEAILERGNHIPSRDLEEKKRRDAATTLDLAVAGLRRAGAVEFLVRGLLTRAWLRFLKGARTGPESAQEDSDEAWEIAERGPMKLHMADIHLHRARLFFREADYPWESPQHDLAEARRLIKECGYHRRDEELEDAEAAILGESR
jgi:hypothetical protein